MSPFQFSSKALVMLTLFSSTFILLAFADNIHTVEKRQIGVLARTGALPQGKRSVEVLARNGELPHIIGGKKDADEDAEDLLIDELERAENLSKLRAQALAEKVFRERENKRSVSALARNGELPQKRLSEALSRSGYLIKPPQETVQLPPDILDPEDFLASLARDGGFDSLRYTQMKDRKLDDTFDWGDIHDDDKKNLPASRSLTKRHILPQCCDRYQVTKSVDNANPTRRKRERFVADPDYEEPSLEAIAEANSIEKRFLGRIPQLGRIHQKVQSPSARRRPHLRPNWL